VEEKERVGNKERSKGREDVKWYGGMERRGEGGMGREKGVR